MSEETRPIILETGSLYVRAGWAGDEKPSVTVPARGEKSPGGAVGDSVKTTESLLDMAAGRIDNWEAAARVWASAVSEGLGASWENRPVLFVDVPGSYKLAREQWAQVAFEELRVPAMYLAAPAVLALYANNKTTGLAVGIGHGCTQIMPVFEGYQLGYASSGMEMAGREIETQLRVLMHEGHSGGDALQRQLERMDWRALKESVCEVRPYRGAAAFHAPDAAEADGGQTAAAASSTSASPPPKSFSLDAQTTVTVAAEQYQGAPEILFAPDAFPDRKRSPSSLPEKIHLSLQQCEPDTRRELLSNVLLYGGTATLPGLDARLEAELVDVVPSSMHVGVHRAYEPAWASWQGGSILASLTAFQQMWVTRQEYNESGPPCIMRKDVMR